MKVLLTTNVFLPEFFGGTETLAHGVATTLRERGHSVLIVTGYPRTPELPSGDAFDRYEHDGLPVVRYKRGRSIPGWETNPLRLAYSNPSFQAGFRTILSEFAPDVVHFHHLQRLSITAIDACAQAGIPSFFSVTDFWTVCPMQVLLRDGSLCP